MHYPVHPLLDPRTRATLAAELAQAARNPKLCPLMERAPDLWPGLVRSYLQLARLPRRTRRTLQRQWKRSLAALALLLALGQAPALAATIDVTTTDPNIVAGSGCSLIEAIENANAGAQTHTDCATGDAGADIINFTGAGVGIHTLTAVNDSTLGPTGLPVISTAITIEGNGSTINRDPDAFQFRIFAIGNTADSTGNLTLNETTVSGGAALAANFPGNLGGGVFNRGTATLTRSTVSGNTAGGAGGVYNRGTLTLTYSTVSGNGADVGGGVFNYFGTATLTYSTVSGNSATRFDGGGVFNGGGTTTSTNSTAILTNSTVSGNSAGGSGGGVLNGYRGIATLTHSTVSGNRASGNGGGVGNLFRGDNATGSTATLSRTVVSGNTASSGWEIFNNGSVARPGGLAADSIATAGFNLFGQSGITNAQAFVNFTAGVSDITATTDGTDETPLAGILAGLAPNGGPTDTHALVTLSPAIDAYPPDGSGSCAVATDQRGVTRPQPASGNCDIGSFEVMVPPDLAVDKSDSPDPVAVGDHLTYTLTVNNAGEGDATDVTLTDALPTTEVEFVSVTSSDPTDSCAQAGGEVTCDLGDLASMASATVTIVVKPTATGMITNEVEVTSAEPDATPNTNSEQTTVSELLCDGLVPTIVDTPGNDNDNLRGTNGPDVIHGLGGKDTISGLNGNDVICGGEGDDTLSGNNGNDRLFGENGNDRLSGNNGNDALNGGAGTTDTCNGGRGLDTGVNCEPFNQ